MVPNLTGVLILEEFDSLMNSRLQSESMSMTVSATYHTGVSVTWRIDEIDYPKLMPAPTLGKFNPEMDLFWLATICSPRLSL